MLKPSVHLERNIAVALVMDFHYLLPKKIKFDSIVTELLWFLRGDTNIKYLIDNGCNIWNDDAYNYYLKTFKAQNFQYGTQLHFEDFIRAIKEKSISYLKEYEFGDCGWQYGRLWRKWDCYENNGVFNNNGLDLLNTIEIGRFTLKNYNPQPSIKAKLSTGLK